MTRTTHQLQPCRSVKDKSQLKIHWIESRTQLNNLDLLIRKDDMLHPEQRKKTGQRGHHRSACQTKGIMIEPMGRNVDGQTAASINNRHKLPRAQIGESGRLNFISLQVELL
ncbi:hypothetical protein C1H46_007831 [Malus baccata]|uniref:Uncharacterized protein n=1 Tax=Malus baccata TaxID=106549 RepID=A0A540N6F2_MALBA|nr:hypothetical protein C1H46_007831 [Malus baccata]